MNFFNECKTEEERKALYRKLAKLFHPDRGGDCELLVELNKQYNSPPQHPGFGGSIFVENPQVRAFHEYVNLKELQRMRDLVRKLEADGCNLRVVIMQLHKENDLLLKNWQEANLDKISLREELAKIQQKPRTVWERVKRELGFE